MTRNMRSDTKLAWKNKTEEDYGEFWNDCISPNDTGMFNKTTFRIHNTARSNSQNQFNTKREKGKELKKSRSQKAIDNCCMMYEQWKLSLKGKNQKRERLKNIYTSHELKQCTWMPRINKRKINQNRKEKNYNNNSMAQNKKRKMILKFELDENTYKPNINPKPNLSAVFENGINLYENVANSSFFYRLEKARILNESKKYVRGEKSNYNIRLKKNFFGGNLNKELTKINSEQLKEVFHKELFDLNLNLPQ